MRDHRLPLHDHDGPWLSRRTRGDVQADSFSLTALEPPFQTPEPSSLSPLHARGKATRWADPPWYTWPRRRRPLRFCARSQPRQALRTIIFLKVKQLTGSSDAFAEGASDETTPPRSTGHDARPVPPRVGAYSRSGTAQTPAQPALSSPEQLFGFQMGANESSPTGTGCYAYYQQLAERVEPDEAGDGQHQSEGRPSYPRDLYFLARQPREAGSLQADQRSAGQPRAASARARRGSWSGRRPCRRHAVLRAALSAVAASRRTRRSPHPTASPRRPTRKRSGCWTTSSASSRR